MGQSGALNLWAEGVKFGVVHNVSKGFEIQAGIFFLVAACRDKFRPGETLNTYTLLKGKISLELTSP